MDTITFMLSCIIGGIVGLAVNQTEIFNKIDSFKTPVQIQCYKQTLDHTGMLHRIKCPSKGVK